ncbi:MAG: cupin domain-containing protein [Clostridia bacterium]|nr:cupin domain-containing protein [Clostridia bacterium]
MVEKAVPYTLTDSKTIERIVSNEHLDINHMVLARGDALPEHNANSHVQMIVVRGTITLRLDAQEPHEYPAGHIVAIPFGTLMNVSNTREPVAEIFVVKAPSPSKMH